MEGDASMVQGSKFQVDLRSSSKFFDERSGKAERKVNYVDFCRDLAKHASMMALAAPKVQG